MAVEKLNAFGVNNYKQLNFKGDTNPAPEQPKVEDKKLSEAAKWMIGATAVAASTIAGIAIYRHFNPSAAKKAIQEGTEAVQNKAEEAVETLQQKADEVSEKAIEKGKEIYAKIDKELHAPTKLDAETLENNLAPKTNKKVWDSADMKSYYTDLEEVSEKNIERGKEVYARVDKELHTPTKLDAETLENNLAPKTNKKVWDNADMKSYYANLEEVSGKLSKIKDDLDGLKDAGKNEVAGLFERVKNGEELSVEELNKFADDFQLRMNNKKAEIRAKSGLDEEKLLDENLSYKYNDMLSSLNGSVDKLSISVKKGLPEIIEAKKKGIDKTPEAVAKFEEMLNKAVEFDNLGNKEEALKILKELQKHNISKQADDYAYYLAAFDERNICTGRGLQDQDMMLNVGKYRDLSKKADDLVEQFKKLVQKDETYVDALKSKNSTAIKEAEAAINPLQTAENSIKPAVSTEAQKQQDDLLTMAAVDNLYSSALHTEMPSGKISEVVDDVTDNITGKLTGLDDKFDDMLAHNPFDNSLDDMMTHNSFDNGFDNMTSHYDDGIDISVDNFDDFGGF